MPRFGFTETEARALTDFLVHLRDQKVALSLPSLMSPVERGREVFRKYGCAGCHGADAKGGVPNPNAKTAEQVPGLIYVADGYTKDELKKRILNGQREITALDPKRPPPAAFHGCLGRHHQGFRAGRPGRLSLQLETQGRKSGFLTAGGRVLRRRYCPNRRLLHPRQHHVEKHLASLVGQGQAFRTFRKYGGLTWWRLLPATGLVHSQTWEALANRALPALRSHGRRVECRAVAFAVK